MKKIDLAYMAGVFDGEGCICISKAMPREGRHHPGYHLECAVSMANEYLPALFRFCFGGSIYLYQHKNPKHKPTWEWHISARKARAFLMRILPYLTIKKGEAELAIKFQNAKRNGGRCFKTEEEWAVEEAQRILMQGLKNKSGVA
jgi:hypothetical protein